MRRSTQTLLFGVVLIIFWMQLRRNTRDITEWGLRGSNDKISHDALHQRSTIEEGNCWDEKQRLKRAQVREACRSFGEENGEDWDQQLMNFAKNVHNMVQLHVNEEFKFIYCAMGKTGTTIWKRTLIFLQGQTNLTFDEITANVAHNKSNLTTLTSFKLEDRVHRLKTYTKFLTVRNPLERVLSAYFNKFTSEANPKTAKYFNYSYGKKWISELRKKNDNEEPVKFEEMLEFLSRHRSDAKTFNRHWKPFHDMCHPCVINYDYFVNFTSFEHDANKILARVLEGSSKEGFKLSQQMKNSTTGDRLKKLLPDLRPGLVEEVQKIYYKDYHMFGYPML